jgi:hypothetical protein
MVTRTAEQLIFKYVAVLFGVAGYYALPSQRRSKKTKIASTDSSLLAKKTGGSLEFVSPGTHGKVRDVIASEVYQVDRIVNGRLERTLSKRIIKIDCPRNENSYWMKAVAEIHNNQQAFPHPSQPMDTPKPPSQPMDTPKPSAEKNRAKLSALCATWAEKACGLAVEHFTTSVFWTLCCFAWNHALGINSEATFLSILLKKLQTVVD